MFWADRIAKDIIVSGKYKPYWVDDMKTPSGRIHVGSLRGVVMHDLFYKALVNARQKVTFSYVFDDQDPMDALPTYLDAAKWSKYLGQPLFTIPSPEPTAQSYAEYFALEFKQVFNKIGCEPRVIWGSELYKNGRMNKDIRKCLDKVGVIREIYEELYKKPLSENWYPFHVVCPKCGKESTARVTAWDGNEVSFSCKVDAVPWTKGCGYSGKRSPFSGDGEFVGKLTWKVEWAVKWKVIGVTVEGAGKDHMSAGGSHDVASRVCKRVLKYPVPFPVAHEFFLIGGKKMSSSKGLGSSAKEVSEIMPPYLVRFIFTRIDYREAINFDPVGTMAIPDLFDEYDRCWQAHNSGGDPDLIHAFEYAQIKEVLAKNPTLFLPRFRDVVNYVQQPAVDVSQKFTELKGSPLTAQESSILKERARYAKLWIEQYAPDEFRIQMTDSLPVSTSQLNQAQRQYLAQVADLVYQHTNADHLQTALYDLAKNMKMSVKEAFAAIYEAFLGKSHGPRAGAFLLQYPKGKVIVRLRQASSVEVTTETQTTVKTISRPDLFTIDQKVKETYPSISIGIAIIKKVTIKKEDANLEKEKTTFLESLKGLTNEQIGKYPEIVSYRRLYREMGIDWHSRRPSPEALLRRVALKKGLYTVNTCVDAYNLVVMKNRVSVGAFDADQIKFPTVLRYAQEGEEIVLLGDNEPTKYSRSELAYFDLIGGYNIDFNYRDAQRTMVTKQTKNIWINIDGVLEITPQQVQQTLDESVEKIIKYCGGTLEFKGVVS